MSNQIFSLDGKVVVFTGGCGNLGRVMVKSLLEFGATVAIFDIGNFLDESFDQYQKDGKCFVVTTDLKSTEATRASFAEVNNRCGKIDVLVNCAAYGGGAGGNACEYRLDKIDDDTWESSIDGTLSVVFRCTREAIPYFKNQGYGNIINVASMYAFVAPHFEIYGDNIPWTPPSYGAGKAGVWQFTRYCASALAKFGIRVNCLTPGPFPKVTPQSDMAFLGRLSEKTMLGRTGNPEELNGAIVLLASDASSFMTASNITVDGGMTQW